MPRIDDLEMVLDPADISEYEIPSVFNINTESIDIFYKKITPVLSMYCGISLATTSILVLIWYFLEDTKANVRGK